MLPVQWSLQTFLDLVGWIGCIEGLDVTIRPLSRLTWYEFVYGYAECGGEFLDVLQAECVDAAEFLGHLGLGESEHFSELFLRNAAGLSEVGNDFRYSACEGFYAHNVSLSRCASKYHL